MENIKQEKRRFNRVPFLYSDNIIGTFIHPNDQDKIYAHILNFSIQGLYFTLKKSEKDINEGDKLILLEIRGPKNQDYIVNIELEIKRVLDNPVLEHYGYGCQFINLPDSSRKQIRRFLEVWYLEGRDY
jgi:c-di-GMP-binding flagellar brake protein YcgR